MKKFALFLLLFFQLPMLGRGRVNGWCQDGNVAVTIAGTVGSGTQVFQRSYSACTVTVYDAGTVDLATIFSDDSGTPLANPFTAGTDGRWNFYADDGRYDVRFSGGGISTPFTLGDFQLLDARRRGNVRNACAFTGANAGAQIINAIADLPATGGVVDATCLEGSQTIASDMFTVDRDVTLLLGVGTFAVTAAQSYDPASNNRSFQLRGSGKATVLQPDAAMTVLTVNLGNSNYQSLHISDLAFDLNNTDSTALSLIGAGQKGVVERVYIDNNSSSGTANIITIDNSSHTLTLRDVRIRCDVSSTSAGIVNSSNSVTLENVDITFCEEAIQIPSGTAVSNFALLNSRLEDNLNGFDVDGTAGFSFLIMGNRFEDHTGPSIDIDGLDATTNRVFNVQILSNYFTQLDLAAEDGIEANRIRGLTVAGNTFRGTGSNAEALTVVASVTEVDLARNYVDGVLATITGSTGIPLQVSDVTLTQTSTVAAFGTHVDTDGNVRLSGSSPSVVANVNDVLNLDSLRTAIGGNGLVMRTLNGSAAITNRIVVTAAVDTAEVQILNATLRLPSILFANLGTPANGTVVYCSDCVVNGNPCAGSGTGARATRINGAWRCD